MAKSEPQKLKLVIPAPGHEDDARAFFLSFGVTLLVTGVMFLMLVQTSMANPLETPLERELRLDFQAREKAESRALELGKALIAGKLRPQDIPDRDLFGALRYGRFDLAEEACIRTLTRLPALRQERAEELVRLMTERMKEREGNMPMGCLIRAWFAGELASYPALEESAALVWDDVEAGDLTRLSVAKMVELYDQSKDRPQHPRFYHWLRRCAMTSKNIEWPFCVRMVRNLKPDHGRDLVEMIQVHIQHHAKHPDVLSKDLDVMARALGHVGGKGQPKGWTILKRKPVVNFPYEVRIGAMYHLCRWIHMDDISVKEAAIVGLGIAAQNSSQSASPVRFKRWRQACRYAFGAPMDRSLRPEQRPVPSVPAVLTPTPGDLTLTSAIKAGYCKPSSPDAPDWSCGVEAWTGDASDLSEALSEMYVETRHLNWTREASTAPIPAADSRLPSP